MGTITSSNWPVTLVALSVLLPQQSFGQQADPLVGPADPSIIQRQLEQPPRPPSPGAPIEAPRRTQAVPEGAGDIRFELGDVELSGASVISREELLPLWQASVGREITLADVYAIAQAITGYYGRKGYILSQAVVPPQSIGPDGRVRISVVEGFIDRVLIEGDATPRMRAIAERIAADRPLNNQGLERGLLLLRDLPGLTARAVLRASPTTPNAADLVIIAKRKPVDAFAMIDNRGSRYMGPWQAMTGVTLNSVLGEDTRSSTRLLTTLDGKELLYGDLFHALPIGNDGTTLSVSASRSVAEPGYLLATEDVVSNSFGTAVAISHPFIRSRAENLSGTGRFEARNTETEMRGTDLVRDRIRAFRLSANYDFSDTLLSPAITQFAGELSQGIEGLGARSNRGADLSRDRGRSDFTKLVADASRIQRLSPGLNLTVAVKGQWAFTPLLSSEEFFIGGQTYGRAYDPAEITGDHGLAGKLELAYGEVAEVVRDYQVYGFADGGATWDRDPRAGVESRRTAFSVGMGARANLTEWSSVNVEVAKPLQRVVATQGDDGPRLFLTLIVRY